MNSMEVGKLYNIKHQRKGLFQIRCTSFLPDVHGGHPIAWGIVTKGVATAMLDENVCYVGDKVCMCNGLFSWEEAKEEGHE